VQRSGRVSRPEFGLLALTPTRMIGIVASRDEHYARDARDALLVSSSICLFWENGERSAGESVRTATSIFDPVTTPFDGEMDY